MQPARLLVPPRLTSELRELIRSVGERRDYETGQVVALEGGPCPGLFLVERGLCKIFKTSAEGREQVLLLAQPGDTFADAPAFTEQPMPASVVAAEPTVLYLLSCQALDRLVESDPRLARAIIRHLAHKLQHVVQLVEDLSFRHVQARVVKVLLQSRMPQRGIGAGTGRRPLTQREIAELAGTAREVVTRALGALEERGLVRVGRGGVEVLDEEHLKALL